MKSMLLIRSKKYASSPGQTLIETIVALGLLTTGIVGGLALATYALGASDYSSKQVIATNLAREGVEMMRNIRDTNWLQGSLSDCSSSMGTGQRCYQSWDDGIEGQLGSGQNYALMYSTLFDIWFMLEVNNPTAECWYRMFSSSSGLPYRGNILCFGGDYDFYRQIKITRDQSAPFSVANPRLVVRSTVWWRGKSCPASSAPPNGNRCQVVVEEYLTNWKNY